MAIQDRTLTKRTTSLLQRAQAEAQNRHHLYVGTEDILLALLDETGGLTPHIFKQLNIDTSELHQAIETTLQREEQAIGPVKRIRMHLPTPIKLGRLFLPKRKRLNRRAKRVMNIAHKERTTLRHRYVGTEHVLLALLHNDAGLVSSLLSERGLKNTAVRQEITEALA